MPDPYATVDDHEMTVVIAVSGPAVDTPTDGPVRSLRRWLTEEEEVRGRVRLKPTLPEPGELGTLTEALTVVLAPGGVAAALAGAIVSWVRWHRSDLRIRLRRGNGDEVDLEVTRLRRLTPDNLPAVVDALRRWLDGSEHGSEPSQDSAPDAAGTDDADEVPKRIAGA